MTKEMDEEGAWLGAVITASDMNVRSEAAARLSRRLAEMHGRIKALEKERDAAIADNAALFQRVLDIAHHLRLDRVALAQETALRAETSPHSGAALLEEHRKALVLLGRVHPSVREILSEHEPSHRFHWSVRCMTCAPRNARERAMKEPESDWPGECAAGGRDERADDVGGGSSGDGGEGRRNQGARGCAGGGAHG